MNISTNLKWLGGEMQVCLLLSISHSDERSRSTLFRPSCIQITLPFPVFYLPLSFLLYIMSF